MKKRILALLLVIIMLVVFMPTSALAHKGDKKVHNHWTGLSIFEGNVYMHCVVKAGEGGKIWSPDCQNFPLPGETWVFKAKPDPGYRFVGWTYHGNEGRHMEETYNGGLHIYFSERGKKVNGRWDWAQYRAQAVFKKMPPQYTLKINSSSGGNAYYGPSFYKQYTKTVDEGTVLMVGAYPSSASHVFTGWSGDASGTSNPLYITMDSNKNITANFAKVYRLYVNAEANGSLGTDISDYYAADTQINLNAANPTGAAGYEFKYWEKRTGNLITYDRIDSPIITIDPAGNNFYRAVFGLKVHTVTFKDSQGETLGTETVLHGKHVTKTKDSFTYDTGERPVGDGFDASEGENITSNKTITVETEYEVTVDIGAGTLVSGDLTQWVAYGSNAAEPDVTPPDGEHWATPPWDASFTGITAAVTIAAQYEVNTYTVTFIDSQGDTLGTEDVEHGNDVTSTKDSFTYDTGERPVGDGWVASKGQNITGDKTITVNTEYEVTFDENGGTVNSGDVVQWIAYGANATEPVVIPPKGYHWDSPKWDTDFTGVTAAMTTTAQYEINVYTVTFEDSQGDVLGTEDVEHGSDMTKTKDSFTYDTGERPVDDGWEASEGQNITGDKTITVNTEYEVTFDENGGAVNSGDLVQWVAYGGDAVEPDITSPTGYHWATPAWDAEFTGVPTAITATAQYDINVYTVTFVDEQGDVLGTEDVEHGSDVAKTKDDFTYDAGERPEGDGWETTEGQNIIGDKTITINTEYEVKFDENGGTINSGDLVQWIAYGNDAVEPDITSPTGYHWATPTWDVDFTGITAAMTATAQYDINTFTVTFYEADGVSIIGTSQTIDWDTAAVLETAPAVVGSAFDSWVLTGDDMLETDSLLNVRENISAVASYILNGYTVTFTDFDGTVLGTDGVLYGGTAVPPVTPEREGHTFVGWSEVLSPISGTLIVTAVYEINTFMIEFVDFDGGVIATQTVDWNTGAAAPADPTRDGFTFAGWDTEFDAVTEDLTVTALYEEVVVLDPEEDIPETNVQDDAAVIEQEDMPQAKSATMFPWWWILIGVGGATLLFLLLFFWTRRKGQTE